MGKRGPKPKRGQDVVWSADLAYAVGLIVTDGCLSNDGRHLELTSKDVEQLENFKKCLNIEANITYKPAGYAGGVISRVQFGDVVLYRFLERIGLTPAKTKTIGEVIVPDEYFFDFLRGHLDGDGSFYSYYDPRWPDSFMFYFNFLSASKEHILWLKQKIKKLANASGSLTKSKKSSVYQLKYAKSETLQIARKMYYTSEVVCLSRKRIKLEMALRIEGKEL